MCTKLEINFSLHKFQLKFFIYSPDSQSNELCVIDRISVLRLSGSVFGETEIFVVFCLIEFIGLFEFDCK